VNLRPAGVEFAVMIPFDGKKRGLERCFIDVHPPDLDPGRGRGALRMTQLGVSCVQIRYFIVF
jgi:hypothetical protein